LLLVFMFDEAMFSSPAGHNCADFREWPSHQYESRQNGSPDTGARQHAP
jgi:hypothetical protein